MKTQLRSENSTDRLVAELLDDVVKRLQAGEQIDLDAYIDEHGECARQLKQLIPTVKFLVENRGTSSSLPKTLGDFRILREIGRGGMGVVYEAQQESLRRRVALKVFAFTPLLDRRQLQRFKNEAQAAASLEHPNIVRVYSVNCERGVYYYAMQFIEGQDLAEVVEGLRQLTEPALPGANTPQVTPLVADLGAGRLPAPPKESSRAAHSMVPSAPIPGRIPPVIKPKQASPAPVIVGGSTRCRAFFRTVANLGVQAAEALEHAHQMGIVHRDVKPSNLLVDQDGRVYIADFGLARTPAETNLTMTGDLVGTLRYMSPEQVQAKHGVLDHRTDVYSLGVTLYELLTLRQAFEGDDRQALARCIVEQEPSPITARNKAVPRDLETIVLKAMAKEPQSRYATAQALAEDLKRFLQGDPVRARRLTFVQRKAKWVNRHRYAVATAIAIAFAVLLTATALMWRAQRQEALLRKAVEEQRSDAEENLHMALAAVEASTGLHMRLSNPDDRWALQHALSVYERVAEARYTGPSALRNATVASSQVGNIRSLLGMHDEAKVACDKALAAARELVRLYPDMPNSQYVLAKALAARGSMFLRMKDLQQAVADYTEAIQTDPAFAAAHYDRAVVLSEMGETERAIADCTEAIRLDPEIHQAHHQRGTLYASQGQSDKALADYNMAIKLYPKDPKPYNNRGLIYLEQGEFDKAVADFNLALRMDPSFAKGYFNRGNACLQKKDFEAAIAEYSTAICIDPQFAEAYNNRGVAYKALGKLDKAAVDLDHAGRADPTRPGARSQAIADQSEVIRLNPGSAPAYAKRADLYWKAGEYDKALQDANRAIAIDPKLARGYFNRGNAYVGKGEADKALADYTRAIELDPKYGRAYNNRGFFRWKHKAEFREAIADLREAIRCEPYCLDAYLNLAELLATCPDDAGRNGDEAMELAKKAVQMAPTHCEVVHKLGLVCYRTARWQEAVAALETARRAMDEASPEIWDVKVCNSFLLAMAYWQLDDKSAARRSYKQADAWVQKHHSKSEDLRRLHVEAAALLGLNNNSASLP